MRISDWSSDVCSSDLNDSAVYKTLLESTKAIPWKIDWKSMTFSYIGPQIESLLGWSTESWASANDWAERMHPEDRDWVVNLCVSQSKRSEERRVGKEWVSAVRSRWAALRSKTK